MTDAPLLGSWRISLGSRISAVVALVVFFAVGVQQILFGDRLLVGAGLVAVPCLLCWALAFRPRLDLYPQQLCVQNPLARREVSLRAVEYVESSYGGMVVGTTAGKQLTVWAVQQPSTVLFTRRRTRSDDVADVIMRQVRDLDQP